EERITHSDHAAMTEGISSTTNERPPYQVRTEGVSIVETPNVAKPTSKATSPRPRIRRNPKHAPTATPAEKSNCEPDPTVAVATKTATSKSAIHIRRTTGLNSVHNVSITNATKKVAETPVKRKPRNTGTLSSAVTLLRARPVPL